MGETISWKLLERGSNKQSANAEQVVLATYTRTGPTQAWLFSKIHTYLPYVVKKINLFPLSQLYKASRQTNDRPDKNKQNS
ncbi:MAG: hypothetical protein P8X63_04450 [Desulfuromonadaceae bacterium]